MKPVLDYERPSTRPRDFLERRELIRSVVLQVCSLAFSALMGVQRKHLFDSLAIAILAYWMAVIGIWLRSRRGRLSQVDHVIVRWGFPFFAVVTWYVLLLMR